MSSHVHTWQSASDPTQWPYLCASMLIDWVWASVAVAGRWGEGLLVYLRCLSYSCVARVQGSVIEQAPPAIAFIHLQANEHIHDVKIILIKTKIDCSLIRLKHFLKKSGGKKCKFRAL